MQSDKTSSIVEQYLAYLITIKGRSKKQCSNISTFLLLSSTSKKPPSSEPIGLSNRLIAISIAIHHKKQILYLLAHRFYMLS